MNATVANHRKKQEENSWEKYSRGLRNQNGEHSVNISKANILETQLNHPEPPCWNYK